MMHFRIHILLLLILSGIPGLIFAQKSRTDAGFRSPVNYPITLSGAFAEIRRNHFHSGIDIRTGGAEGKPIYAIADGYVSRVNISAVGFGKALYIDHPNGYTSLYAHLQRYAGAVATWVKKEQYARETFAMDTEVAPGILRVKKGDLIAYSGNSGSSGGPHIHFEIRETKTQEIIDPLDFGFMPPDQVSPRISYIKIYPSDERSMVDFSKKALLLPVSGGGGKFHLKRSDTIKVSGRIYFGIETTDGGEGGLTTGVHSIRLKVDNEVIFSQDVDRFAFSETRYVNSILDYPVYIGEKRKIQRSWVAPNNKMRIFKDVKNQGVVNFSGAGIHKVQYEVEDAFGHVSSLIFQVKSHPPPGIGARPPDRDGTNPENRQNMLSCMKSNRFAMDDIKMDFPEDALYEDLLFEYSVSPRITGLYAPVHHLHNIYTPLHTWCQLSIKCENLPADLAGKAVIVAVGAGNKRSSIGGKYEKGWITGRIREFGKYSVAVDTRPPSIVPVNIVNNKNINKQTSIRIKISDDLSGIESYRGTLNGQWILMDYDAKNRLLVYSFDEKMKKGKNKFILVVKDAVGNSSRFEATLVR